jgi:hypothetical protein
MPTLLNRKELESRYALFDVLALNDQRSYYRSTVEKHRKAARQVNRFRATFAFLTGFAAALAGLLVQSFISAGDCSIERVAEGVNTVDTAVTAGVAQCNPGLALLVSALSVMAIIFPTLGAFFSSLADLYQWDRLITIYDTALENIELADARSPDDTIPVRDVVTYRAALIAYAEGTLSVMSDETAQWGQAIRTPPDIEQFIEEQRVKAAKYDGSANDANPPQA